MQKEPCNQSVACVCYKRHSSSICKFCFVKRIINDAHSVLKASKYLQGRFDDQWSSRFAHNATCISMLLERQRGCFRHVPPITVRICVLSTPFTYVIGSSSPLKSYFPITKLFPCEALGKRPNLSTTPVVKGNSISLIFRRYVIAMTNT